MNSSVPLKVAFAIQDQNGAIGSLLVTLAMQKSIALHGKKQVEKINQGSAFFNSIMLTYHTV